MANLKFKVGGVWNQIVTIKGDKGDAGDALPAGGVAGQLLIKNSATNNDATWQNNPSAPLSHTHTIANVTGLQSALDGKVDDSQVLTNVPAGAIFTDTVYTHPASHPASIITQDASNRFVTDAEKTTWNGKATKPTNESTATNGQILTANGDGTSAYKNLLIPKNWIINGMFDVWQRGTTQTTSDYGSDDRWQNVHQVSTKTHSRQAFTIGQTDVPNNPKYFSRTVVTSGNSASSYVMKIQKVEDVATLSGKTMSYSFWAKADANKSMSVQVQQHFGTGGSSVVNSNIQKFNLTSAWQRFTMIMNIPSVVGKTIGDGNHTAIRFWFDAGSDFDTLTNSLGNQSGTFDIVNVSLVEGSVAVECQNQPYDEVLGQCLRYYVRYDSTSQYVRFCMGTANGTTQCVLLMPLLKKMRTPNPAIEAVNLQLFDGVNATNAVSSLGYADAISISHSYMVAVTTGLTQYRTYYLLTTNSSGYLAFSSEL